jgi:hypothetical protein
MAEPFLQPPRSIDHSLLRTCLLFGVFGVSSWLMVNGTFLQLPAFANQLPEGACWCRRRLAAVALLADVLRGAQGTLLALG